MTMRRKNRTTRPDYIKTRISQLMDDMNKAHDQHDKNWYNRLIQELNWAYQMDENPITIVTWKRQGGNEY